MGGMPVSSEVSLHRDGDVLEIVFDRPAKKNALTADMYRVVADALEDANRSGVRVILLAASGRDFTVGADIGGFQRAASGESDMNQAGRFIRALARTEPPIVAGIRGYAVGVGATLLFHCDLVYVAHDARIVTPFVQLGLVPEAASTRLAPLRLGHARAFAMLAACEAISGDDAVAWGLANQACAAEEVVATARAAARRLAALPAGALRATKRLMRDAEDLVAVMDREGRVFDERLNSAEARAAFEAFRTRDRGARP